LFFWIYVVVYILRASHGRYILPLIPVILFFFLAFLREGLKDRKFSLITLIVTVMFVSLGLVFETSYVWIKILINICIISALFMVFVFTHLKTHLLPYVKKGLIFFIGMTTMMISLSMSYLIPGQIGTFLEFGYCAEYKKIADSVGKEHRIWSNMGGQLFRFYYQDLSMEFGKGKDVFVLKDWIPKSKKLLNKNEQKIFSFRLKDLVRFQRRIKKEKIDTIALVVSNSDKKEFLFPYQNDLERLDQWDFLVFRKKQELKNITLYIYDVKD